MSQNCYMPLKQFRVWRVGLRHVDYLKGEGLAGVLLCYAWNFSCSGGRFIGLQGVREKGKERPWNEGLDGGLPSRS